MLSKIFANIKLGISFWLIAVALLVWGGVIFTKLGQSTDTFAHIFWLHYSIPAILVLGAAFVNYFLFDTIYRVTKRNYYIPLVFVLIWAWQPALFTWQNALAILLLAALYFTFQRISEGGSESISHYLNVGILSFLAALISPYGIFFLALSLLSSFTNTNKNWRQFVLPFYGFALAFGMSYGIAFMANLTPQLLDKFIALIPMGTNALSIQQNLHILIPLGVLFLFAFAEFIRSLGKASVLKQKILRLLLWHFVLASLLLFGYNFTPSFYGFIFFPAAILFANHLQFLRKFLWREIWIWILIAVNFIGVVLSFFSNI